MSKSMIDADALISAFETASNRQGAQLRKTVGTVTLNALQGRELTLKNIKGVLKQVSEAASAGLAKNTNAAVDPHKLLDQAVTGMDEALLKAVKANEVALAQLLAQGADLREKHLSKALEDLDRFEDTMFAALKKTAGGASVIAGTPLAGAWDAVLEKMQAGGSRAGSQATTAGENIALQMAEQMHGAMRQSRAASVRAATAMAESYATLVSGVLMGMSEALQQGGSGGGSGAHSGGSSGAKSGGTTGGKAKS